VLNIAAAFTLLWLRYFGVYCHAVAKLCKSIRTDFAWNTCRCSQIWRLSIPSSRALVTSHFRCCAAHTASFIWLSNCVLTCWMDSFCLVPLIQTHSPTSSHCLCSEDASSSGVFVVSIIIIIIIIARRVR